MDRPHNFRAIRIAVTVVFLLLCGAFAVLWMRSYRWHDAVRGTFPSYLIGFDSSRGRLEILVIDQSDEVVDPDDGPVVIVPGWKLHSRQIDEVRGHLINVTDAPRILSNIGFGWRFSAGGFGLKFPHWAVVTPFAALAAIFVKRWRFSLLTLLTAMTLIAVLLGLGLRT